MPVALRQAQESVIAWAYLDALRGSPATISVRTLEFIVYFTSAPGGTEPNETSLTNTVPFLISILSPANSARPLVPDNVTSLLSAELDEDAEAFPDEEVDAEYWSQPAKVVARLAESRKLRTCICRLLKQLMTQILFPSGSSGEA